ncbi:hypothetical protein Tco_0156842 [Tanacetum coccineum]
MGYFQIIRADRSSKRSRRNEVFGYILLVKIKLLIKKLRDSKCLEVTAAKAAEKIGCATLKAPFTYLGSKFKWAWCFCTQRSSLWAWVIKGIHGEDGKLGKNVKHSHPSIWLDTVREMKQLKNYGTNLIGFIHKKMGNGADTSFWEDMWRGDVSFKSLYPRVYTLDSCKNVTVEFQGEVLNRLINERWLLKVLIKTHWINVVPIKVNVHAWKIDIRLLLVVMAYPPFWLEGLPFELERDLLPIIPRNLQMVSSGVKSSSRWLPVWELATRSPTPFTVGVRQN